MIVELLGASAAEAIFVFQAAVDENGTNPFRLALFPGLMPPQVGAPVEVLTATVVDPNLVESIVEVAVIVTVSGGVPVGVKTTPDPEGTFVKVLSVPSVDGDTERFTVFVNAPVPVTMGEQLDVCAELMVDGEQTIETAVIVGGCGTTVSERVLELLCFGLLESITLNVSDIAIAAAVGVPLITPVFESLSPAGKVPLANDQLYGVVPPDATRVAEYAVPTVPLGREMVEMLKLAGVKLAGV